jgi:cation:H+ antiporter
MALSIALLLLGLPLLIWSSDRFVDGAIELAHSLGMSALLIGIIIVGFGTSVPEMLVSAIAAFDGAPNLAMGNAYGSNITNIALILGLTSLLKPITVQSQILRRELPILALVSSVAYIQLMDRTLSQLDASYLLLFFLVFLCWSIWQGMRKPEDNLGFEVSKSLSPEKSSIVRPVLQTLLGLLFLLISSRMLVKGAVAIAQALQVSDLVIGLTIVAVGTSLPELASSIMAIRKGEHDIALGNVIGSNIFNTLAVVGIAGSIKPFEIPGEILSRDLPVMIGLTLSIFILGFGIKKRGRINRFEGGALLVCYFGYLLWVIR